MLQNIRDKSQGTAAKVIVGLIICTFALFGIESIVSLGGGEDAPATVNGEDISEGQIVQMVEMQMNRFKAQFGENFDPSFLDENMLRDSATESLIQEKVLKQAAEEAGVRVSDQAIDQMIVSTPQFQENGVFDRNRFDMIIRNAGFTRFTYREMLRDNVAANQNRLAWQLTAFATDSEAKRSAELEVQKRNFAYVEFALEDAKKEVVVTDEELNTYYEANKDQYKSQEKVRVEYIELDRANLADEVIVEEEEIESLYSDREAEAESNKEYRAAHILLIGSDEEAQTKMKEIQSKLNAGEAFETLAEAYSEDDSSKMAGGDLGFSTSEVYEDEFAAALEGLEENGVSNIVETRDGLHLIKLLETRKPELPAFADIKSELESEVKLSKAGKLYVERLEILKDESYSADNLSAPAASLSLEVKTTPFFTRQGGVGIAKNPKVIEAAFSEDVLYDNINSAVIELADGKAVVVRVKDHEEEAVKPFESVKSQVEVALVNQKAKKALEEKAESQLALAKEGQAVDGWVVFEGKTRKAEGVESAVLEEAFKMGLADSGSSYKRISIKGSNQAIIRLDAIEQGEVAEVKEEDKDEIAATKSQAEFNAYKTLKMDVADIVRS